MVDLLVGELALRTFVREELRAGAPVHAPDLLTLEVLSALTRIVREGGLTRSESRAVLDAYAEGGIREEHRDRGRRSSKGHRAPSIS